MSPIVVITCDGGTTHSSTPTQATLRTAVPSTRMLRRDRMRDGIVALRGLFTQSS
jgi:hypothetical protein